MCCLRSLTLFAVVAVMASVVPARAAEKKAAPTVVVRLNSLDGLIADVRYLAEAAGKGEEAKQATGLLKQFGGKGLDTTKPIGLYGRLAAKIEESDFALLLPVTDEKGFLALLESVGVKYEKTDMGDVYKVDLPNVPFPAYFRFADGYVYGTVRNAKMLDKARLLSPAAVLPPGHTGVVEIVADLEQIPTAFKDLFIGQVSLRLAEGKGPKKGNETDEQFQFRAGIADQIASEIKAIINDGKELTVKLDIDRKNAELVTALHFTAKPGSKLAESLASLGQTKSLVANLIGSDSALSGRAFFEMPLPLRKSFDAVVEAELKKAQGNAPDEASRELLAKIFKAIRPTLQAAEFDAGFDLRGPSSTGKYTLLAGMGVKEGADIEKAARALYAAVPPDARAPITLDAEKVGSVSIHRVAVPAETLDAEFKRVFGAGPVYLAIRKDVVLIAVGDKALDALKDVLTREPKAGKLLQLDVAVARVLPLDKKEDAIALAKKLFATDKDADKVHLSLAGGKSLDLRLSAKTKLLEFALRLDEERKKGNK